MSRNILAMTAFLAGMAMTAAQALPNIDGNVGGIGDDYDMVFDVNLILDSGLAATNTGKLYIHSDATSMSFGFIAPLDIDDNTYGANRAPDWGATPQTLDKLSHSDKWVLTLPIRVEIAPGVFEAGTDVELSLEYFKTLSKDETSYDVNVKTFKQGADLDQSFIEFKTSLLYNYEMTGGASSAYFSKDGGKHGGCADPVQIDGHICSPKFAAGGFTPNGPYVFDTEPNWVPEIMYEFRIQTSALIAGSTVDIAALLADAGEFHMSPNKQGRNATSLVCVAPCDPDTPEPEVVPEPATLAIFGLGLAGLSVMRRRRKRA